MSVSSLRLRTFRLAALAVLCWAGVFVFGPAALAGKPNRSPSVAPMTRGAAEAREVEGRSRRQNRLPSTGSRQSQRPEPGGNAGDDRSGNEAQPANDEAFPIADPGVNESNITDEDLFADAARDDDPPAAEAERTTVAEPEPADAVRKSDAPKTQTTPAGDEAENPETTVPKKETTPPADRGSDARKPPRREALNPAKEGQRRQSIQAYLDPLIKSLMNELRVPGAAVAVVRRDRVYMLRGYGYGDLSRRARVDAIRTRFPVGRVSAHITSAAVLHAHDRGLIRLDAAADSYLARPLPRPLGRPLTVEDLLLRETGFAAVSETGGYSEPALAPGLAEYVRRARPTYSRRDTGPSDFEINLLGRLLERQSRLDFAAHVRRFFFRPIGMNRSSFAFLDPNTVEGENDPAAALRKRAGADVSTPAGWARPYRYERAAASGEGRFVQLPARYFAPAPALGLSTTAGDMARYMVMLLNGGRFGQARLLGEETARRVLDTRGEDRFLRPTYYYALEPLRAFETNVPGRPAAKRALISRGDLPGYAAALCVAPEKGYGVFIATNSYAPEFRRRVLRAFLDRFAFR